MFNSGSIYDYFPVEPFVFYNFLQSESIGWSYRVGIKGQFPCQKVEETEAEEWLNRFRIAEQNNFIVC